MRPIPAIPNSDARSDQSDGSCAQTALRNYDSARPRYESSPRHAGLCPAGARASESLHATPAPAWAPCHTRHRLAPGANGEDRGTGQKTPPQAGALPGPTERPGSDSRRWHWLLSLRLHMAWRERRRLNAEPSRICRDPWGRGPSARPFFCRLLGAIEQHFLLVDPLQGFIPLGQSLPRQPNGIQGQPDLAPPLDGFVGRKTRRQHPPPNAGNLVPCHINALAGQAASNSEC